MLVKGEGDIIGCIAYSIYKQKKIEHIEDFIKTNDGRPLDSDLVVFNAIALSHIKAYRIEAEQLLGKLFENVLKEEISRVEQEAISSQAKILRDIIAPITPLKGARRFWQVIMLDKVLSGLILLVLTAVLTIAITWRSDGLRKTLIKMLESDKTTEQASEPLSKPHPDSLISK